MTRFDRPGIAMANRPGLDADKCRQMPVDHS
jgi:hypothetical protein